MSTMCQGAMEKCILHIQLMHRPGARESKRENCADSSQLHHRTECLIIVHTRSLSKTLKNPASLVALQSTINLTLMRLDPLTSHHIVTRRSRHEVPRLVSRKSFVLLFHHTTPVRICQGLTDRGQYWGDLRLSLGGEESRGPKNPSRLPNHHGMSMMRILMEDRRVVHHRLPTRVPRWRQWWRWRWRWLW
jgi:hypothetical protein